MALEGRRIETGIDGLEGHSLYISHAVSIR